MDNAETLYNENKLYTSIMNKYLTVINYNELNDYITENKNAILYVSILGDKEINRFEEKFKNIISDENLKIYEDFNEVSATTLENYFKCPFYAFLQNILKLQFFIIILIFLQKKNMIKERENKFV